MHGPFPLDDGTLRVVLILPGMALDQFDPFDDRALLVALDLDDLAALAFFCPGDDDHFVALFNVRFRHNLQMTSGASEIIFMNRFSRNSRATGPKMRVPRGLF